MSEIVVFSKKDFDQFKDELITEIKKLFETNIKKTEWIRSAQVRKMLGISDSTLQTMRVNGSIPVYKLDKTWFYKYDEIIDVLEKSRTT